YTGSVGVQLFRDLSQAEISRLGFFKGFSYFMSVVGVTCMVAGCIYFLRRHSRSSNETVPAYPAKE
ncbi:MAG TPA: DUF5690 family protein, partial [Verrucomicrobiae bacterium]|nr:DUF5690 family protein [Verrucomicrobiae bacterium]